MKSEQGDGQAALTARPTGPHETPRDARRAEGSHGSDSILTLPLVRLALALARRGFTASAIHSASATSRSVSVKLLQFTQAAQFRPLGCHVISPSPLRQGRRQLDAVRAAPWDKLARYYLCAKDSAHSPSGPAPILAPPPATPCVLQAEPSPLAAGWHSELPSASASGKMFFWDLVEEALAI